MDIEGSKGWGRPRDLADPAGEPWTPPLSADLLLMKSELLGLLEIHMWGPPGVPTHVVTLKIVIAR